MVKVKTLFINILNFSIMKKKNLNKTLQLKTISVCNLNEVQGGRIGAEGTHYTHCIGPSTVCTDYCTITCQW
ncbi:hypothetical protein IMCC3317_22770 [Kordia antarctica]|uniref:Uncharacterized protein n=2 Tax=Kordia antarctica TaxID=1218801 RepID=A0A7L4ZKB5_9FLAO|nr:hypothetical protein IMCC3317_22770 [Kordia antarctica]